MNKPVKIWEEGDLTYKVQTVDTSSDTLNKARHRDRYVFPKFPIIDPELVVEEFVPRPLQRARDKKSLRLASNLTNTNFP